MRASAAALLLLVAACASTPTLTPHARPLTGAGTDYDPLVAAIGNASVVLLGEATHGTREFYVERARISERLIREKGFTAIALEAEWTDALRIDRYVRGESDEDPLGGIDEFPLWMWRNREFAEFVEWIREYNRTAARKVGVYGLDLYDLEESREALPRHLDAVDPAFAQQVMKMNVRKRVDAILARRRGVTDPRVLDELFFAEQNARVIANAEEHDRALQRGDVSSWNLRDQHMAVTLDRLQRYLIERYGSGKIVVWAHNSHVGDARATGRARYGEWTLGQLVREHWPRTASFTVGFSTHSGTVVAADEWNGPARVHPLPPSMRGSHSAILHEVGLPRFLLLLSMVQTPINGPQRGVGVVYRPYDDWPGYYRTAKLREQFDAVIHIDETTAVTPLDPSETFRR